MSDDVGTGIPPPPQVAQWEALIDAVAVNSRDDLPYLVLADWYDENGMEANGHLVRVMRAGKWWKERNKVTTLRRTFPWLSHVLPGTMWTESPQLDSDVIPERRLERVSTGTYRPEYAKTGLLIRASRGFTNGVHGRDRNYPHRVYIQDGLVRWIECAADDWVRAGDDILKVAHRDIVVTFMGERPGVGFRPKGDDQLDDLIRFADDPRGVTMTTDQSFLKRYNSGDLNFVYRMFECRWPRLVMFDRQALWMVDRTPARFVSMSSFA